MFAPHSTNFVPSSSSKSSVNEIVSETVKPPVSEIVKLIEVSPSRKVRVCKVEFNQPSCWLYSVPNLLVF